MSEWVELAKGWTASAKSDVDWGLTALAGIAAASADAFWNVLTPAFFDPTGTGVGAVIVMSAGQSLWRGMKKRRKERSQTAVLEEHCETLAEKFADTPVWRSIAVDLKLARGDFEAMQILRARLEALDESDAAQRAAALAQELEQERQKQASKE